MKQRRLGGVRGAGSIPAASSRAVAHLELPTERSPGERRKMRASSPGRHPNRSTVYWDVFPNGGYHGNDTVAHRFHGGGFDKKHRLSPPQVGDDLPGGVETPPPGG